MEAVILAAGQGTRMRPITPGVPKSLIPVANRPFISLVVDRVRAAGAKRIVVVLSPDNRDKVHDALDDVQVAVQEVPRGTADAVAAAENAVTDDFLLVNGDTLIEVDDLRRLADASGCAMGLSRVDDPSVYGIAEVVDGRVVSIDEKPEHPRGDLANTGTYRLTRAVFDAIRRTPLSERGELELTTSLMLLHEQGIPVHACLIERGWRDFGAPWHVLDLNDEALAQLEAPTPCVDGAVVNGPVVLGTGCTVGEDAIIQGPAVVGDGCEIGAGARIGPGSSVGPRCVLGDGSVVEGSVLCESVTIGEGAQVLSSVLGTGATVGMAATLLDTNDDGSTVRMTVNDRDLDTGRTRCGALVGCGAAVDDMEVVFPGTLVFARE